MPQTEPYQPIVLTIPDTDSRIEGVIIPMERASAFWLGVTGERLETGFWTPQSRDIEDFERQLDSYQPKAGFLDPPPSSGFPAYRRQYLGRIVDGHSRLFVLLIDSTLVEQASLPWREQPILVDDGGTSVFEADFDVKSSKLLSLRAHGEA